MLKIIPTFAISSVFLLALSACSPKTGSTDFIPVPLDMAQLEANKASILVDSQWLNEQIHGGTPHIIELGRTYEEYLQGHIPGALFVDWRTDISDQSRPEMYNVLPQRDFEQLLSSLGISKEDTIIVYDTLSNRASTRMYWTLKYYNHSEVVLLDGGLSAWTSAGFDLNAGTPSSISPSEYKIDQIQHHLLVDKAYIENNLANQNMKTVDGRPFDQYTGEAPGTVFNTGIAHERGGHIYGAKTVPWADNLNADGTFKSLQELASIYENHEITNRGVVVTYCNEGFHAAMPWFVLHELLGFDDVRLYDSSMAEWANIFDTPMKTGEHCM